MDACLGGGRAGLADALEAAFLAASYKGELININMVKLISLLQYTTTIRTVLTVQYYLIITSIAVWPVTTILWFSFDHGVTKEQRKR